MTTATTPETKHAPGTHYGPDGQPSSLVTPERAKQDHRLEIPPTLQVPRTEPVGRQLPTRFVAPLWHTTAGEDAVDLAAACGLDLLPWQQLVLRNALGERLDKWAAFEVCLVLPRQNGKNVIITARQLAGLFLFDEEQQVHTAHKFKTARSAHRDLVRCIERQPELWGQVKSAPTSSENTAVVLHNGQRIDFLARQNGQGRGLSGDTVYLDEAFQLGQSVVGDLMPTLSARPRPQLWYTSSASMEDSDVLEELERRAIEHPELERFYLYASWEADLGRVSRDSAEAAAMANPSLGYFLDWEWVEGTELRSLNEEQYNRERLGVKPDKNTQAVIGDKWDRGAIGPDDIAGLAVVKRSYSVEVTPDRDMSVLAGAAELEDGRVVVEILDQRAGTAWVAQACKDRVNRNPGWAGVVVDSYSGAAAVAPHIIAAGVPVTMATTKDLTMGTADFYDKLTRTDPDTGYPDPHILHPADGSGFLDDAAYTARRRLVGASKTAWTWDTGPAETPLAPLRAVTLAVKGLDMDPVKPKKRRRVA